MDEAFIGMICSFGFNFAPRGWKTCDGQILPIAQNQTLFSLVSNFYGGDGRVEFALPDLRGRVMVGMGGGPGLTPRQIGRKSGSETVALDTNSLAPHHHTGTLAGSSVTIMANSALGTSPTPDARGGNVVLSGSTGGSLYGSTAPDTALNVGGGEVNGSFTTADTGSGQPFHILQPECAINFSIATIGLYPPRN